MIPKSEFMPFFVEQIPAKVVNSGMKIQQTLRFVVVTAFSLLSFNALAQASIRGTIVDNVTNEPIPGAVVRIEGRSATGLSDFEGKFRIENLAPGLVNVRVEAIGYQAYTAFEVQLTRAKAAELPVRLKESTTQLEEVEITAQAQFQRVDQSPVSVQSIGITKSDAIRAPTKTFLK
jgi:hypothetical protein